MEIPDKNSLLPCKKRKIPFQCACSFHPVNKNPDFPLSHTLKNTTKWPSSQAETLNEPSSPSPSTTLRERTNWTPFTLATIHRVGAKKDKDVGNIEDFTEILKLYDKQGDGRMPFAELTHILQSLGERLEKDEAEAILKACCDQEDEDGFIPYKPFLKRLMAGPFPDGE